MPIGIADRCQFDANDCSRQAITAASSANGSANSVWLKRMSSSRWRMVLNMQKNYHAEDTKSTERNAICTN